MNSAINLKEPDRIPISSSGFHKIVLEKLFKHFNVNDVIELYKNMLFHQIEIIFL
jgi:hypothetical protein